jgi:hypothetical protein
MSKKLWWLSWDQTTSDERPLTFPPNEAILGWWNSGSRCSDDAHTICAFVQAETEEEAKAAVKKDWPEAEEWRFCGETSVKPGDRFPLKETSVKPGDRFPLKDWMKPRFAAAGLMDGKQ